MKRKGVRRKERKKYIHPSTITALRDGITDQKEFLLIIKTDSISIFIWREWGEVMTEWIITKTSVNDGRIFCGVMEKSYIAFL